MEVEKLVFIDETWAATNMTRSYGRAPKGCRWVASAPLGDWQTTTFVAGLRHHRRTAPMVADGPMDGELFLAWVEQFLCPHTPGRRHRHPRQPQQPQSGRVRQAHRRGRKAFAKLKTLLRKAGWILRGFDRGVWPPSSFRLSAPAEVCQTGKLTAVE
jgi:hypothetical protein